MKLPIHPSKLLEKSDGKQIQQVYWSAPPKIDYAKRCQTKLMADAQKAYIGSVNEEDEGKVHIPDTLDDSDSNSDSFSTKIKQLTNDGDQGQSSKGAHDASS